MSAPAKPKTPPAQQPTTAIAKASPLYGLAARFNIDPNKLVEVLRGTVIRPGKYGPATNEEIAAFCIVAQQYGLNPFTREIHAFTSDKGVVPIIGIDGWTHIVNSHESYDGCDFEDTMGQDGKPDAVTCTMHIKGRDHPVRVTERYSECYRNTGPWNQMPWRMLRHKAYMQAARYAFGLSGLHDEDEGRDIVGAVAPLREPIPMPRAVGELAEGEVPNEPTGGEGQSDTHTPPAQAGVAQAAQAEEADRNGLEDTIEGLKQKLEMAETKKALEAVGADMLKQRELLGEVHYDALHELYVKRFKVIEGKKE